MTKNSCFRWTLLWSFVFACAICSGAISDLQAAAPAPQRVAFNRDIRPILSSTCFECHGPDARHREADLRLDQLEYATDDLGDGRQAIVPGNLEQSELWQRIISHDADLQMPPPESRKTLTPKQRDTLRRWIEQGAKWQGHWSYLAPKRPASPDVQHAKWARNPIDRFVLARLQEEALETSPEAPAETLIRRLSLDLTGLPPTPREIDAFLADNSNRAYENLVDRLLASQRFGERMAAPWLDAARFADTNGYQSDDNREMWRWRDGVIDAFNQNKPFDQFTREQLAGDLLPHATLQQKIASGFNRNHRTNAEGGSIPEEFLVEYVVDRVNTTSTVWLGLTMGCVRCHDHKFDPFTQRDYYSLFAYFYNIPEPGRARKHSNSPPVIKAPTPPQQKQLQAFDVQIVRAEKHFAAVQPELRRSQLRWERKQAAEPAVKDTSRTWAPAYQRTAALHFQEGAPPEGAFKNGPPEFAEGVFSSALRLDGKYFFEAGDIEKPAAGKKEEAQGVAKKDAVKEDIIKGDVGKFDMFDRFTLSFWIKPARVDAGVVVSRMTEEVRTSYGYSLSLQQGKLGFNLIKRWLDDGIRVETEAEIPANRWTHIAASYDGSRLAAGIQMHINGRPSKIKVLLDELSQDFVVNDPFRLGGGGPGGRYNGLLSDINIYARVLSDQEVAMLAVRKTVRQIVAAPAKNRTAAESAKLRQYYLETQAEQSVLVLRKQLLAARRRRRVFNETIPTVMVMHEMATPRQARILVRGEYDNLGEKVAAAVPKILPPLPSGAPNNRLGLAEWLVSRSNPLTARVTVNRFWQMLWGVGLVKTVDDFGSQGEWPSHPELLDWLAVEFMDSGWDVKHIIKTMVMSAAYRQSANVTPELVKRDAENRLLARGPRFRLSAEAIRDQALAVSGLLVEKIGGPSVKPRQPAGLWKDLSGQEYQADEGDGLHRRSLYTFWKRTVSPPTMLLFDAPSREFCVVRRSRTNTPLQALALLNEATFVEASLGLARRMLAEGGPAPAAKLAFGFRLATARWPDQNESQVLLRVLEQQTQIFKNHPDQAAKLVEGESKAGESKAAESKAGNTTELAAYATLANLILNLDETITKE